MLLYGVSAGRLHIFTEPVALTILENMVMKNTPMPSWKDLITAEKKLTSFRKMTSFRKLTSFRRTNSGK
jgi:hypothetical protein